jgi:dephospho-CoA kinase
VIPSLVLVPPMLVSRSNMSETPISTSHCQSTPARWKHGSIPVIGLTGGIGSGKSRVAALLRERGAVVIDADLVGHRVLEEPEVRERIVKRFGCGILRPAAEDHLGECQIDRRALGTIVFSDPSALADLEKILHPRMRHNFEQTIEREVRRDQAPAVVLDAAILLEAGWNSVCDLVVFVDTPLALRLDRVARNRGWTAEAMQAREANQWPCESKRRQADIVLSNDAGIAQLELKVDRLFRSLCSAFHRLSPTSGTISNPPPALGLSSHESLPVGSSPRSEWSS